jgi:glycosyltransferase involved in cell wall biosynthesis
MALKRKFNIMQIIGNLDIGGAQEVVRTLVEYLASDECRPVVCTFKDGPLRQDIERLGIPVHVLPARRYGVIVLPLFVLDMLRILWALAKLIKQYQIDVVQTHLLRSMDFLTLFLPHITGLKVVLWTFHNSSFELPEDDDRKNRVWLVRLKNRSHRFLYKWSLGFVSGFIAVSEQVEKAMIETIGSIQPKITVICNGVDVKRYEKHIDTASVREQLRLAASDYLIATVATLKEQKGHCYLIEAMAHLTRQHPEMHALFIGDGELRAPLQAQVEALDLGDHIHFLGNRKDVPALLASSDLFVLPSLWEGLPMALLEAMATGLPIVATKVSGTVQVVIPGESGILVPPGDVQSLAQAIDQLAADPMRAQAMGKAAKQRIERDFSAQKQADEHLALYRRLL